MNKYDGFADEVIVTSLYIFAIENLGNIKNPNITAPDSFSIDANSEIMNAS